MQANQFNNLFEKIFREADRLCRHHHLPNNSRTRFLSRLTDMYLDYHPDGRNPEDYPTLSHWKIRKIFSSEYPLDEIYTQEGYVNHDY